jgi:hypothetical protein
MLTLQISRQSVCSGVQKNLLLRVGNKEGHETSEGSLSGFEPGT